MQEFGKLLSKARRRRKWSQQKLALTVGLSRSYINDIEHGRSVGTLSTWITLARALELSLDGLFLEAASCSPGIAVCRETGCRYCAKPAPEGLKQHRGKKPT